MELKHHLVLSFLLRLLLIIYGEWQDANFNVSYTDVDYNVFTDASRYMSSGESPYKRSTYRYPPILAALLLPNIWLHRCFGKVMFSIFDVLAGGLGVVMSGITPPSGITLFLCLYSPLSAIISTRGSADSLSSALVISSIMAITKGHVALGSIILALAAHLRVYPILFFLPMWLSLTGDETHPMKNLPKTFNPKCWFGFIWCLISKPSRCCFLATFVTSLATLTSVSYMAYGHDFLQESYLYHFSRVDTRHNFSIHFYMFLLAGNFLPSIVFFLPQLIVIVLIGVRYGTAKDLAFACFCQVYVFVMFNKVITAQYFIWPLSIFPVVIPILLRHQNVGSHLYTKDKMHLGNLKKILISLGQWVSSVGLWLYSAYRLEFLGHNTFPYIWVCSLLLFGTNVYILKGLINCYDSNVVKKAMPKKKLR